MHVFAYSRREGTLAAKMKGQIDTATKKARSAALIALGDTLRHGRLTAALQAPLQEVLFESFENGLATGHTATFLEVVVPSPVPLHGEVLPVRLLGVREGQIFGEIAR